MEERFIEFAARTGEVVNALPDTRLGRHIAGQLVRSGTAPASNYAEACAAESRADFVHKLGIVLKELRETRVWLKLAIRSKCLPATRLDPLIVECSELMNIVGKSIVTAKTTESPKKRR
ncbi:MAG: four helix bundle protein [Verrucomicrobia bacterium 12-59-8]|nr:MAG: four helix bundle protein [Verrucomicrobia bacterium 12-59-8]